MKNIFFWLIILIACACACKNDAENETKQLRPRFSGFLRAISEKNIDSIQVYTYPKLFTILPPDQSRKSMEKSYHLLRGKAELDSIKIDTIRPVLHIDKGHYSVATYSLLIKMPLDSTEKNSPKSSVITPGINHVIDGNYPTPQSTLMATLMRGEGVEVTAIEEADGMRTMWARVAAIAAKDEFSKEWSFFIVTGDDQELINKLFPRTVLEKLATYF